MGAHGTLEQALSNVASFRDASSTDRDVASKGSSKSSKHKSHKKHKKAKDKGKDRKDASKKHKRSKDNSSSDSEDNFHGPGVDLQTQLAKGREAVRVTRFILAKYPEMRSDLRQVHYMSYRCIWQAYSQEPPRKQLLLCLQLLGRIDQGAAVAIDAIPENSLRTQLATLFDNLLLNVTKQVPFTEA